MPGFESLYLAQFAIQAGTKAYEFQQANQRALEQRRQANQQVALNNNLAYNAHLNINQAQALELKKFGLDDFELKKNIRREQAKNEAVKASFGGAFGQSGASFDATVRNIFRHGSLALARKDLNFKALVADFNVRHKNVDLEAQSKNNQAQTGLSTGGSLLGTGLAIVGSGINTFQQSQVGTQSKS